MSDEKHSQFSTLNSPLMLLRMSGTEISETVSRNSMASPRPTMILPASPALIAPELIEKLLTLPKDASIFAPKYQLYLPSKEELKQPLEKIAVELGGLANG